MPSIPRTGSCYFATSKMRNVWWRKGIPKWRFASSWLGLAATAQLSGNPSEERAILERAEAAETMSAAIVTRLGQIAIRVGELEEADRHIKEAIRRVPGYAYAWWVWGELAEAQGLADQAVTRYAKAIELRPGDARWMRYLGQLLERLGDMGGG